MARRGSIVDELLAGSYPELLAYAEALAGDAAAGEALLASSLVTGLSWPRQIPSVAAADRNVRASLARRALRSRKRVAAAGGPDAGEARTKDQGSQMLAVLAALTPAERVAVVLRHHDGLAVHEIAALLRRSERWAAGALQRGETALCEALGVEVGEIGERSHVMTTVRGR